jgi:hypothetical protein
MTDTINIVAPVLSSEPAVPAVPESETPPEKQITLSQSALDNLIKSRQSSALKKAAALEIENQRLREVASGQGADASELERIRGELAASKIERDAIAASAAQSKKESFITGQVQKQGFVCDATTLSQLTQDDLTYDEATKQFKVVGSEESPDAYFKRFAESRPYLVKSTVISGTGQGGSGSTVPPPTRPLSFYFGPSSNAAETNRLSLRDPQTYKRLRAEAVRAGLVS